MLLGRFEDSHQLLLGNIFVLELVPGGPAFHCEQIQVNDILFKVDQQPVKGWSLDQVAELIKGSLFLSLTFFVSVLVCICPSLRWRFFDVFVHAPKTDHTHARPHTHTHTQERKGARSLSSSGAKTPKGK
jgi:hypothetical protein